MRQSKKISYALLDLLTPYEIPGLALEHWGPESDGGYVVPVELMRQTKVLVSGGVADNVQFEAEVAEHVPGIRMGLFDHTILFAPDHTPTNARWHKLGLGTSQECISLEAAAALAGAQSGDSMIVKLDIESAEWEVIESTSEAFWDRVNVLIIELHGLDRVRDWDRYIMLLEKLNRHLLLIHVHGNNYAHTAHFKHQGVAIPICIEATYINRKSIPAGYKPAVWNHGAPGPLDRRNNPEVMEIPFDFWLSPTSRWKRLITRIGLYVLPWRVRKNILLNLTPKSRKMQNVARAHRSEGHRAIPSNKARGGKG